MTDQIARPFRSLTTTLTKMFLLSGLFVLLISTILGLYFSFQTQKQVVVGEQQLLAQNAANTVRGFLEEKFRVLDQAADVNNLATNEERHTLVMNKLMGREQSFRQLILLDLKGKEIKRVSKNSIEEKDHILPFKQDILAAVTAKKQYISHVYIDETTSEPLVLIAIAANNLFHEPEGAFIAEVNLKFMWNLVNQIRIGDKGLAYVIDREGALLAFRDTSKVLRHENLSALQDPLQFTQGTEDTGAEVSKGILGTYVVSSFVPLGTPDWAVVIELPVFEAYRSVLTIALYSLLVLLFGAIVAIGSGRYFSKRITKGIINLSVAAENISQGNLDAVIETTEDNKDNEIGQLATSFTTMTSKLRESYKTLEDKVVERTKELDSKVEELGHINKLMVDRELKMVELKKEIEDLKANQK